MFSGCRHRLEILTRPPAGINTKPDGPFRQHVPIQRKPHFDDRTVFLRTITTRPLTSLPALTHEGNFAMFNPCNELASKPSSRPFASGCGHACHIHRSSHRLRPAVWLFDHSPLPQLAQCSEHLGYLIPDALCVVTYMAYRSMTPISACNTSDRYLWTQPSLRVHYPSCISIRSSSSPWAAATTQIRMYPSLIGLL